MSLLSTDTVPDHMRVLTEADIEAGVVWHVSEVQPGCWHYRGTLEDGEGRRCGVEVVVWPTTRRVGISHDAGPSFWGDLQEDGTVLVDDADPPLVCDLFGEEVVPWADVGADIYVMTAEDLPDLLDRLTRVDQAGEWSEVVNLDFPTFGGEDPRDDPDEPRAIREGCDGIAVWSWDETSILISDGGEFQIVRRAQ